MSVEEILKKHGVYTRDLEIDLLRHFVDLRNEILQGVKNTEQANQPDSGSGRTCGKTTPCVQCEYCP